MKRLICIFSLCMFLNACSDPMPQSGQASHTWGNGNTYVGEWKDGKPNGEGTATYGGVGQYVGTFKKGKRHGHGEVSYVDGRKYVGEWKNGDPWEGEEYAKDGNVIAKYSVGVSSAGRESVDSSSAFADELLVAFFLVAFFLVAFFLAGVAILMLRWLNNIKDDEGDEDNEEPSTFLGAWNSELLSIAHVGQLLVVLVVGGLALLVVSLVVSLVDLGHTRIASVLSGEETINWDNGDRYVGARKDGKKHGQGTFTWADGSKYVGVFKDGKRHGQGTYTHADGAKYVGEYKDGTMHGQGTYTSADGDKYVGEWKDGKYDGQGTYTSADGDKYVGEFKDEKQHGQGTMTWVGGEKYIGEWRRGEPWQATQYDKNRNVTGKFVKGRFFPE